MIKIIFILFTLLFSPGIFAEEVRYETNVPDVYIKNFQCANGTVTFNLVNKTDKYVLNVYLNIFDATGDPIDKLENQYAKGVAPQSGKSMLIYANCKKIDKFGFSVRTI